MTIAAARASVTAQWLTEARTVVAGLLVDSAGSAPLEPGAVMLIDGEHNVEGTVTGGCVEAAVLAEAQELLAGDRSARLVSYGISDQLAGDVGLMCGGLVHILVHEISGESAETELAAARAVIEERPVVVATLLDGEHAGAKLAVIDGGVTGGLGAGALLDASVARDARGLLDTGRSVLRRYGADGSTLGSDLRVFMRVHAPRPQMVLFGAIDFSAALAPMAAELGYAVTICDARETFVRSPRFARSTRSSTSRRYWRR
ncbi:XdhC family protein [Pseudonocardia sp. H11422]|uniref:XdhC family protein n=1 Tax=Pseudonocardia sp. H11422 TaxID=2835866 RepID=UPI001BDC7EED|nr:XdhC family protein [Pseudonocardia sp. H11422]